MLLRSWAQLAQVYCVVLLVVEAVVVVDGYKSQKVWQKVAVGGKGVARLPGRRNRSASCAVASG